MTRGTTYKEAGVDIAESDRFVRQIWRLQRKTFGPRVIPLKNGFAGLFALDYDSKLLARNYRQPVLVACTDGVGTKMNVAVRAKKLDTIGIDLVAMSVNDLVVTGGEPLVFLDYIATAKVKAPQLVELMKGVVEGCRQAGCALLGGETAEHPGFYHPDELDVAGFAVGVVEKSRIIDGRAIKPGDVLIGVASGGLHSNGYSLVRHVLFEKKGYSLDKYVEDLGCTLAEELLKPTVIYVETIRQLLRSYKVKRVVKGIAHVTGGGLYDNVPRVFPAGTYPSIDSRRWEIPPIFGYLQAEGKIDREEMFHVFNMGIGMVLVVSEPNCNAVVERVRGMGRWCGPIGVVARGRKQRSVIR